MSVPIATSHGRSGYGPQLSLSYDSGAGNECFGWSLSLPAITRKTDKGLPTYQDPQESDVYVLSGSEDLVPILELENRTWVRNDCNPFTASRKTRTSLRLSQPSKSRIVLSSARERPSPTRVPQNTSAPPSCAKPQ
jgi:Salmonella virulence plasmid 65kDa B protein